MSFWDLLFIAIGLAMDALAVAIGKGLAANGECKKICIITGLYSCPSLVFYAERLLVIILLLYLKLFL